MITDAQFAAWLKDAGPGYTVLCEIGYIEEVTDAPQPRVLRLSTLPYVDTENEYTYPDWIHALPAYSRDLVGDNLNNFASTIGQLILNNADGRCDWIADLYMDGSDATFKVGDVSWPISDFRTVFVATVSKASVPSKERLVIELRDSGLLLNRSIGGEFRVGGEGPNADEFRSINIGYVAQTGAKLFDEATQTWAYNDTGDGLWEGAAEQVVSDNGYPVGFTDNGDGTFTLDDAPVGTITTNVDESHRLTSSVIEELVANRGGLADLGKYDGPQDTFEVEGDEDYPLGLSIPERRDLIELLREVCDSGLCFWAISRFNRFFFGRLRPSYIDVLGVSPVATITEDHITSFSREPFDPKYHKLQIYMTRNWEIPGTTVSTDESGDPLLSADELAVVTRRGLSVIQGNSVGAGYEEAPERYHKTLSESEPIDTLLSDPDDAEGTLIGEAWMEVARANQLPWLHNVTVTVPLHFYERELGNVVTLEHSRFGYEAGADFQIIGIDIGLLQRTVTLRLLRRHIQVPYAGRSTTPVDDAPIQDNAFQGRPKVTVTPEPGTGGVGGGLWGTYYPPIIAVGIGGAGATRRPVTPPPENGYIAIFASAGYLNEEAHWRAVIAWSYGPPFDATDTFTSTTYPGEVVTIGVDKQKTITANALNEAWGPPLFIPAQRSELDLPNGFFVRSAIFDPTAGVGTTYTTTEGLDTALGYSYSTDGISSIGVSFDDVRYFRGRVASQDFLVYFLAESASVGGNRHYGVLWAADLPGTLHGVTIPPIAEPAPPVPGTPGNYRFDARPLNYFSTRTD